MWTVEHGGRMLGTAVLTPPRDIVLGDFDTSEAVEMLVLSVRVLFRHLPGAIGNLPGRGLVRRRVVPPHRGQRRADHVPASVEPGGGLSRAPGPRPASARHPK